MPHLPIEVEGLNTDADFDVIEILKKRNLYHALLGIGWVRENLEVINFNKSTMLFENHDTRVISPLDPLEGK